VCKESNSWKATRDPPATLDCLKGVSRCLGICVSADHLPSGFGVVFVSCLNLSWSLARAVGQPQSSLQLPAGISPPLGFVCGPPRNGQPERRGAPVFFEPRHLSSLLPNRPHCAHIRIKPNSPTCLHATRLPSRHPRRTREGQEEQSQGTKNRNSAISASTKPDLVGSRAWRGL